MMSRTLEVLRDAPIEEVNREKRGIRRHHCIDTGYRIGQIRNDLVYRLLCENTVDERITDLLQEKQAIFDAFADESIAAQKSIAFDDKSFGNIIKDEIEHLKNKTARGYNSS